ncbi:hypothetical protein DSM104299_01662 [Baekduia alba]|uniref:hypothetical protein n=1 Tax=Baekduia alba TaxID=2997333 RepID=UPI002340B5C0|nr:hypothetical protein [Baekduia alba]WCB92962.1 hypothetical protein DSM104299_01662 [Baekduia alba]
MRRLAAFTAAVALLATAAPVPLAGAQTSEATFNHRANDACASAGAKIESLPTTDADSVVKNFRATTKVLDGLVKRLNRIEAPKASNKQYRRLVAALRQENALLVQALGQARAHHVSKSADLLFKSVKAGQRSVRIATDLDLTECARDRYTGVTNGSNG